MQRRSDELPTRRSRSAGHQDAAPGCGRRAAAPPQRFPEARLTRCLGSMPHTTRDPFGFHRAPKRDRICRRDQGKPPHQLGANSRGGRAWLSRARIGASSNEVPPAASRCEKHAQGALPLTLPGGGDVRSYLRGVCRGGPALGACRRPLRSQSSRRPATTVSRVQVAPGDAAEHSTIARRAVHRSAYRQHPLGARISSDSGMHVMVHRYT